MLSSEITFIFISACTSEWRLIFTLKIPSDLISFKEKEQTTESVLKDRLERLAIYDKKEIDFFNSKVNFTKDLIKNELETEEILKKTIKEIYRVIAVKDEYEVARMHLETSK